MVSFIKKIDRLVINAVYPTVVALGLLIAFSITLGVFSRSLLNVPLFGLEEITLICSMWFYMMGASMASRERSHLSADFIEVITDNRTVRNAFKLLAGLITVVMSIFFVKWSYDFLMFSFEKVSKTPVFSIPWYLSQLSLLIASILMSIYLIRDLLKDVKDILVNNKEH
jgi:TRAP-type C4-dicarboxylate transport system permease small subunit